MMWRSVCTTSESMKSSTEGFLSVITVSGTVKEFQWTNPHSWIQLNVPDAAGGMKDLGVSQSGWMAIALAAKSSRPQSQIELANAMGIEGPSMVAVMDKLSKDGFITREPSPTDRRVKLVSMTSKANAIMDEVGVVGQKLRDDMLVDLSQKEREQLVAALSTMKSRLIRLLETP